MPEPTTIEVENSLDTLSKLRAKREALLEKKEELVKEVMTDVIKHKLAQIEKQFEAKYTKVNEEINNLEVSIREKVKVIGITVKASQLQAVWSKPVTKWDTKSLEGYAAGGHPEILQFKKEGEPSVSIREIKQ